MSYTDYSLAKNLLFLALIVFLGACESKPDVSPATVGPIVGLSEAQLADLAREQALAYSTRYVYLIPSQQSDLTDPKQRTLLANAAADFQRGVVEDAIFVIGSVDPVLTQRFFMAAIKEVGPNRLKGAPVVLLGGVEKSGELEKEATRIQATLRLPAIGETRD